MKTQTDIFAIVMAAIMALGMFMWSFILPTAGLLWMVGLVK
jgi:hypothetical protein